MHRAALFSKLEKEYNERILSYNQILENKLEHHKQQYEIAVARAKEQHKNFISALDELYTNSIKRINAIYDAYEVTNYQLLACNTDDNKKLLEQNLSKFPNFSSLYICTYAVEDTFVSNKTWTINVKFDINKKTKHIISANSLIEIFTDNTTNSYKIKINNIIVPEIDIHLLVECNMLILGKYTPSYEKRLYIFIDMITGHIIYTETIYQKDTITYFCVNKKIIGIHVKDGILYIRKYYKILHLSISKVAIYSIGINVVDKEYQECYPLPARAFYCDDHGLYISSFECIYYTDSIDTIILNRTVTLNNFNKIILYYGFTYKPLIKHIDYKHYRMTFIIDDYPKPRYTCVTLGFEDLYKLKIL